MKSHTAGYKLLAHSLALLLIACGSARHTTTPGAEELSDFVLVIEETNGQVHHSWQRATELDLPQYTPSASAGSTFGSIVLASRRPKNCDQEQIDCFQSCMKSRLPSHQNHINRADGSKGRFCESKCLEEYLLCLKLQGSHALQFHAASDAVEWLKRNRTKLLVGTVVIIAGVAFVTLSAGAGAAVLAPVVLVAG